MRNIDIDAHIEHCQKNLDIPICFNLSEEKLMSNETIAILINKILTNALNDGDKFALLEILKRWHMITASESDDNL